MDIFRFAANLLFPPSCVACGVELDEGAICAPCSTSIEIHPGVFICATCGGRLPSAKKECHPSAPYLLAAPGRYHDDALRALIRALKFHNVRAAAGPLGEMLADHARGLPFVFAGWTVVPIPLSRRRERGRGFNQAALIAREFAARMALPLEERLLTRVLHRTPQSDLHGKEERTENIRGCFVADEARAHRTPHVVLVDDVTTSGATFTEAAAVLRAAGVKKIVALAVARA